MLACPALPRPTGRHRTALPSSGKPRTVAVLCRLLTTACQLIDFLTSSRVLTVIDNCGIDYYRVALFTPCAGSESARES